MIIKKPAVLCCGVELSTDELAWTPAGRQAQTDDEANARLANLCGSEYECAGELCRAYGVAYDIGANDEPTAESVTRFRRLADMLGIALVVHGPSGQRSVVLAAAETVRYVDQKQGSTTICTAAMHGISLERAMFRVDRVLSKLGLQARRRSTLYTLCSFVTDVEAYDLVEHRSADDLEDGEEQEDEQLNDYE